MELSLSNKESVKLLMQVLSERCKEVNGEVLQMMVMKGTETAMTELCWTSKETGKMFDKVKGYLVRKEKMERSKKKDRKQGHVNLSKATTKNMGVAKDEEESDEEEEVDEEVQEEEEKDKKIKEEELEKMRVKMKEVRMGTVEEGVGFVMRIVQIMKLIQDEKNKKEWSLNIFTGIAESACEVTSSKEWKEKAVEKVKEMHNARMKEEKGTTVKNKNPLLVQVSAGKGTENERIAKEIEQQEEHNEEFNPEEDFM